MNRSFATASTVAMVLGMSSQSTFGQSAPFALLVFPDATVGIQNTSNSSWFVSAYVIESAAGSLHLNDWLSIQDQFVSDPDRIRLLLGADFPRAGFPFAEFAASGPTALGEALPLPLWRPNVVVSIGKPLGLDLASIHTLVDRAEISWAIDDGTEGGPYPIVFIPEPATFVLLLLAAPVLRNSTITMAMTAVLAALGAAIARRRPKFLGHGATP